VLAIASFVEGESGGFLGWCARGCQQKGGERAGGGVEPVRGVVELGLVWSWWLCKDENLKKMVW